jgi:CBS-domain-containing membrane protein
VRHVVWSWLGGCVGIGIVAFLSHTSGLQLLMAPLGATCVLAFGVPDSPLAQPRAIIGGHFLSALVAMTFFEVCGDGWWSLALALATAIAVMQVTNTVHPPAGATSIVVILGKAPLQFLLTPVLAGAALLVIVALVFNNLARERQYPRYWI